MAGAGRVGYEYRYRFWIEDEIISVYRFKLFCGVKLDYAFEIRTNFIMKSDSGEEIMMDSERFAVHLKVDGNEEFGLNICISNRMEEYWMTKDEVKRLAHDACDFGRRADHENRRIIPIVVGLDVCTVQQEGESLSAAMDRAIRAQNLVPLYLWNMQMPEEAQRKPITPIMNKFLITMPRFRLENNDDDIDDECTQICGLCLRKPSIGAQISMLPCCYREFHSHCLVRWLEDNSLCPECHSEAYNPQMALEPPLRINVRPFPTCTCCTSDL